MPRMRLAGTRRRRARAFAVSPSGCMNSSRRTSPGVIRGRRSSSAVLFFLVVVGDFDVIRHSSFPAFRSSLSGMDSGALTIELLEGPGYALSVRHPIFLEKDTAVRG